MAKTNDKRLPNDSPKDTRDKHDQENYAEAPGTNQIRLVDEGNGWYRLGEPLYRTWDGRLVHENNPDGRQLFGGRGYRCRKEELVAGGILSDDKPKESGKK